MNMRKAVLAGLFLAAAVAPSAAQAATPEQSVSDNLDRRRYVAIGDRAYVVGFEDARYYAQGWHIRGEMGGFWASPIKMLDGLWFGVDDQWVGPATRFTSGAGYVKMNLPTTRGVRITRTDFAPDGHRAVLVGLRLQSEDNRTIVLKVDAHSELMSDYPWGWTTPNAGTFNLPDTGSVDSGGLLFREQGTPPVPNAEPHNWAAFVRAGGGAELLGAETGPGHFGPQDGQAVCSPTPRGPTRARTPTSARAQAGSCAIACGSTATRHRRSGSRSPDRNPAPPTHAPVRMPCSPTRRAC